MLTPGILWVGIVTITSGSLRGQERMLKRIFIIFKKYERPSGLDVAHMCSRGTWPRTLTVFMEDEVWSWGPWVFSVHLNSFSGCSEFWWWSHCCPCVYIQVTLKKKKKILTSVSGLESAPHLNDTDPIRCVVGCDDGFNWTLDGSLWIRFLPLEAPLCHYCSPKFKMLLNSLF